MPPNFRLPAHDPVRFTAVGRCIYCGSSTGPLSDEHIVPYSAGGRWILPGASCRDCAKVTTSFEGEFARTILGQLRMLYNMPTRRPKERPKHLPLKVKYPHSTDWEIAYVDRSVCPFLVLLPLYPLPSLLTGEAAASRGLATRSLWVRGGGFWVDRDAHMEWLCQMLGATEVMPTGTVETEPWCLTIAKVAHSYAVAKLGFDGFTPVLAEPIRRRDLSSRSDFLGGGTGNEPASDNLHEVSFDETVPAAANLVVVKVRLLAVLGLPTYTVVAGRRS